MNRAIITVDLGFGDSGKGTIVDALVRKFNAGLVVKFNGGAQCGHNVVTDEGVHHEFSQFGSGTFAGAKTFLSKHVLVNPLDMMLESDALRDKVNHHPLDKMFVDERALVTTPFHVALNRIREMSRSKRNGSCGKGIRETVVYAEKFPKSAIRIEDLRFASTLSAKLNVMRWRFTNEAIKLIPDLGWEHTELFNVLRQDVNQLASRMTDASKKFTILASEGVHWLLNGERTVIFEGAQGILLDQHYGFRPHITKSSCTNLNALEVLREFGFVGRPFTLGIARTYITRHGAGPLPSENPSLAARLAEPHNNYNDWQQDFRVGDLDIPALRYAVECTDGIDGLAITHLDAVIPDENWAAVIHYERPDLSPHELHKHNGQRNTQEAVTRELMNVKPFRAFVQGKKVPQFMAGALGVPVKLLSSGPAYKDKLFVGDMDVQSKDITRFSIRSR
jgi:adenylosuccinate synthase